MRMMLNSKVIFSVQESPEGGYEVRAFGFSIFTQADSLEELKAAIADALACHFEEPHSAVIKFRT